MRDGVTFYRSYYEALQEEENLEKRLQGLEAIIEYALYGTEPEGLKGVAKAAYIIAKPVIDSSNAASDAGKRGGAPKGNQNAKKATENNPKQPPLFLENNPGCENKTNNDNENDNDNENNNENNNKKIKADKPHRHQYGENKNVLLSDEELEKLKSKFPDTYQEKIEDLSWYMKSKRKSYADHYATILNWERKDQKRQQAAEKPKSNNVGIIKQDYDVKDLEARLLGRRT